MKPMSQTESVGFLVLLAFSSSKVALLVELLPIPSSPFDGLPQPLLVATTHLACGEELEEQRLTQADWLEHHHFK